MTLLDTEQVVSRMGISSGQPESQGRAGLSLRQRFRARQGVLSPSLCRTRRQSTAQAQCCLSSCVAGVEGLRGQPLT